MARLLTVLLLVGLPLVQTQFSNFRAAAFGKSDEDIDDGEYAAIPDGTATLSAEDSATLLLLRELAGMVKLSADEQTTYRTEIGDTRAAELDAIWTEIYTAMSMHSGSLATLETLEAKVAGGENLTEAEELEAASARDCTYAALWLIPTLERLGSVQMRIVTAIQNNETEDSSLIDEQTDLMAVYDFFTIPELIWREKLEALEAEAADSNGTLECPNDQAVLEQLQTLVEQKGYRYYQNDLLLAQLVELEQNAELTDVQEYALRELRTLQSLIQLQELNQLLHLYQMFNMVNLDENLEMQELSLLQQLNELQELTELTDAEALQLAELQEMQELRQLMNLFLLGQMQQLQQLVNLRELTDAESTLLGELGQLAEMINLNEMGQLGELGELKELYNMVQLGQLAQLDELVNLMNMIGFVDMAELGEMAQMSTL